MKNYILIALVAILACVALTYACTVANVATAPARVVNDSITTQNIVGSYESFFDIKAGYDTRIAEIASLKSQLDEQTGSDRRYAQTDLNGTRQTCRALAQRYNADSLKMNRGTFKAHGLPDTLNAQACEA